MGRILDCLRSVKESFSVFSVSRIVEIKDERLAAIQLLCVVAVALYIGVYQVLLANGYMKIYGAQPTFNLELTQLQRQLGQQNWFPAYRCNSAFSADCRKVIKPLSQLPYCCNSSCQYITADQCTCPWATPGLPEIYTCKFDDAMGPGNVRTPTSLAIETFSLLATETYNMSCLSADSCDRPWTPLNLTSRYIAGVEDYLLRIDHSMVVDTIGLVLVGSTMNGALLVEGSNPVQQALCANPRNDKKVAYVMHPVISQETTNTAPCWLTPDFLIPGLAGSIPPQNLTDMFYMSTLLGAAGYDLDSSGIRRHGVTLAVSVEYSNLYGLLKNTGRPQFGVREPFYIYRVSGSDTVGSRAQISTYFDAYNRAVEDSFGVRFSFTGMAGYGAFDFLTLTQVVVTGSTLTGIGAIVTQLVALHFLKRSRYYKFLVKDTKFDFEGFETLEKLTDEELDRELMKRNFPVFHVRETKILKLLEVKYREHIHEEELHHQRAVDGTPEGPESSMEAMSTLPEAVRSHLEVLEFVHRRGLDTSPSRTASRNALSRETTETQGSHRRRDTSEMPDASA